MYAEFDLEIAHRLDGALAALAEGDGEGTVPLAGGTNLIVDIRARRAAPGRLVYIGDVDELRSIRADNDRITIGGGTTVSDILRSETLAEGASSLVAAAGVFGGQMVRNAATVAGNIACGSPAADLVPPLLVLGAELVLTSKSGSRTVALDQYFSGYKEDVRRADELITAVSWPKPEAGSVDLFYKLGRRKGDAVTVTGVAVKLSTGNGRCSQARIALGAVAPVVLRARKAEAVLEGEALTPALIDEAARQAADESDPIDDVRASAAYRRHTVRALTRRLVAQAWKRGSRRGEAT
jgi:carbon-monoxide dehydrogenase medium subunit